MSPLFIYMNKITLDKFFDLYPSPYPFDVPERIAKGLRRPYDINDEKHLIFPEKNSKRKSIENVLIFGSGYSEGLYHALRNPDINFVCVDFSGKAINYSNDKVKEYSLNNITFHNTDLLSFNTDVNFDVIYAINILQYLKDPIEGLNKCLNLLDKSGALLVSVSSSYYYDDIDYMRILLNKLNYDYTQLKDIEESLNFLKGLDNLHPSKIRMVDGKGWIDNNDFVSRYMAPIHQSFSINNIFSLISDAKCYFQGWYHNYLYYPSALIREKNALHINLYDKINSLPDTEKWDAVCRIFRSKNDRFSHTFCLRKEKKLEKFDFKLLNKKETIISLRPYQLIKTLPNQTESFALISNFQRKLSSPELKICNLVKNPMKIDKLLEDKSLNLNKQEIALTLTKLLESSIIYLYE